MGAGQYLDTFVFEPWCRFGVGLEPPLKADHGIRCLLWKHATIADKGVFGLEIVDAANRDRIAWAFCVRDGSVLDIEEFYVWPSCRRQGFGRVLARLVRELATELKATVRLIVSYSDVSDENRESLSAGLDLLGLHLNPSPVKWAPYVGLSSPSTEGIRKPHMPVRPAAIRDQLSPSWVPGTDSSNAKSYRYPVFFGTNRLVDPEQLGGLAFTSRRAPRGEEAYGVCMVTIPKTHEFGSLGSPWWQRWLRWTDDRLTVERVDLLTKSTFADRLQHEMSDANESDILLYIHGYNVDFENAALRAAQIGFDLKVGGATAFFSWPSLGTGAGYLADGASIDASEGAIADFIVFLGREVRPRKIHIIAHSMGNRGLLRALHRIQADVSGRSPDLGLGQVFLAARGFNRLGLLREGMRC